MDAFTMTRQGYLSQLYKQVNTLRTQKIESMKNRIDDYAFQNSINANIDNLQVRIDAQCEAIEAELNVSGGKNIPEPLDEGINY